MKTGHRFRNLSRSEREFMEMVLLEEMERQAWYAVSFSEIFDSEVLIVLQ